MLAGVCLHTVPAFAGTLTTTDADVACSNTDLLQIPGQPPTWSFSAGYASFRNGTPEHFYNGVAYNSAQYGTEPIVWPDPGNILTFTLNTSVNKLGYDLSQVNTYFGHNDSGRRALGIKVEFSKVGADNTFFLLYDMDSAYTAPSNYGKISMTAVPADEATGVKKVRITFEVAPGGVSEIDVFGTATPSMGTVLLIR